MRLSGFSLFPGGIPSHNPKIAPDFDRIDPDDIVGGPPWHESFSPFVPDAPIERHLPQAANGRDVEGFAMPCHFEDFYFRIHLFPSRIDLGSIVSETPERIALWNAYLTPKTLLSVGNVPEGVRLRPVEGSAPPDIYAALEERLWDVVVSPSGPSRVDDRILFDWLDAPDVFLFLTGARVIAWAWPPNWADGVEERLEWLTDVLTSRSGMEQRRALRVAPRRSFEASFVVTDGIPPTERHEVIQRFRASACGTLTVMVQVARRGIDLFEADTAVFYGQSFDFESREQSIRRIQAPGIKDRSCRTIDLVYRDSLDERILASHGRKENIVADLLRLLRENKARTVEEMRKL